MMKKMILTGFAVLAFTVGCRSDDPSLVTDRKHAQAQAAALAQAHEGIGMPAIGNFSEKRMMKDLYELRDKPFATHTYIVNEMQGCLNYLGPSVGYGLPYSTQYTAPTRNAWTYSPGGTPAYASIPQAEPNGLFMPSSAEGTWIMLKSPGEDKVQPVYVEPRVVVSPFRLPDQECAKPATPVNKAEPSKR